jgi:Hint domain
MGRHDTTLNLSDSRSGLLRGLYASTPVQTAFGWQPIAALAPGDLVMTKDEGLRPIVAINAEFRQALWSVRLPAGAIGNPTQVMVPPGQPILIKTEYALPFSGDDLALVPATALEGWRGIAAHVPAQSQPILRIRLDRPGILFVGPGLMSGCDGGNDTVFDITRFLESPTRPTLPLAAARHMVAHLVADEAGEVLAACHAAALRPPNLS